MCADLWTWHGQASLSTQPNPQAWDSIRFRFFMAKRPYLKCIHSIFCLHFSQSFFLFLSFAGSLFCNFPPPCNSGSPRAVLAHYPRGNVTCSDLRKLALQGTEIREPREAGRGGCQPLVWSVHASAGVATWARGARGLAARPIMRCNGPSSCVINRGNNTDTVSECTANSLSDLEDNYSRSAADRP